MFAAPRFSSSRATLLVPGGADEPAPELRVALVAIAARNIRLLDDVLVHLAAIDVCVRILARRERKPDEHFIKRRLRHPAR